MSPLSRVLRAKATDQPTGGANTSVGGGVAAAILPRMQEPQRLTVRDIAAELGCTEEDVRTLIREGELRTVACGIRPGLVPRHELDAYQRRLQHRP